MHYGCFSTGMRSLSMLLLPVVLATPVATAADFNASALDSLPSWAVASPPDWGAALVLGLTGLLGVAATAYGLVGGVFEGTIAAKRYAELAAQYESHAKLLDDFAAGREPKTGLTPAEVEALVAREWDELRGLQRMAYWSGLVFFALVGLGLALWIARGPLDALLLGMAGPAALSALLLKGASNQKTDALKAATAHIEKLEAGAQRNAEAATSAHKHLQKNFAISREKTPDLALPEEPHLYEVDEDESARLLGKLKAAARLP